MDLAAIRHAIELLVGLLGLAAFVAIIARPLRLPHTVALVVAGLLVGIGASALFTLLVQGTTVGRLIDRTIPTGEGAASSRI